MAIEYLKELGILDGKELPDTWPDRLFSDWEGKQIDKHVEIYNWADQLEGESKDLLMAIFGVLGGKPLNEKSWNLLQEGLILSDSLPNFELIEDNTPIFPVKDYIYDNTQKVAGLLSANPKIRSSVPKNWNRTRDLLLGFFVGIFISGLIIIARRWRK